MIKAVIINKLPIIDPKDNVSCRKINAHKGSKNISLMHMILALKAEIRTIQRANRIPANAVCTTPANTKTGNSLTVNEICCVNKRYNIIERMDNIYSTLVEAIGIARGFVFR